MNKARTPHTTKPAGTHAAHLQQWVLSGIRVLDLPVKTVGRGTPGCSRITAEVIHVERAGGWDDHRCGSPQASLPIAPEPNYVPGEKQPTPIRTSPRASRQLAISLNTRNPPEGIKRSNS